jgi:hypothetical protein
VAILVALVWRRVTRSGAIASVAVMFPLFFIGNRWELAHGLASLPFGVRHVVQWMVDLYASVGTTVAIPAGADAHLPVEIKFPLYLIPGLLAIIVVSLCTRQHRGRDVAEFYARLDTPLGKEHRLKEMGFHEDDLEGLDHDVITVGQEDRDISKRLLLLDILYLPKLLLRGEAKLSDYKWDIFGVAGGVAFVVLFILFVQYVGSLF